MKPIYIFVFALSLFAMPTFARAPAAPLEPMWVTGEERARVVQQLKDGNDENLRLEEQLDDVREDLRICKSVHRA